ncbi:hypothetical protein Mapa_011812 [Marchantia paleacea]|nr:hypothetical protein Mapa_011812 [Marchantia paleacea]
MRMVRGRLTVEHGEEVAVRHIVVDEQLLLLGVIVSSERDEVWVLELAKQLHVIFEVASAGFGSQVAEALDGDDHAAFQHGLVSRAEAALAQHLGGRAQQVLELEALLRVVEENELGDFGFRVFER